MPVVNERVQIGGERPHVDLEYHPTKLWNSWINVDPTDAADAVAVAEQRAPGDVPFEPDCPPVTLTVPGRRVPEWELDGDTAGSLPASPVASDAP
jgi:hypothetical protein